MAERTVVVVSSVGLHARPASTFAQAVVATGIAISITSEAGTTVNAASILGVLSLGVAYGETVVISSSAENADVALDALVLLLSTDLDAP